MIFRELYLSGAFEIELDRKTDIRGSFARRFDPKAFAQAGLRTDLDQRSVSTNSRAGTLRGLHFQRSPHGETKLVRCTRGSAFDVIVDLRRESPTFSRWHASVLTPDNGLMLYVPEGFAHGFLTLEDGTDIDYEIAGSYAAHAAAGVRFDDPRLAIAWPRSIECISERDRELPYLDV